MKIFPISGYKYGVDEKIGIGLKAKFKRLRYEVYSQLSGKEYDPQPTGQVDADGEEIWRDLEFEKWFHLHAEDYEVQLAMAELVLVPLKGAPPIREVFGEADEEEVYAALSFFGDVMLGIVEKHGLSPESSTQKMPDSKKGTRKAKAVST